MCTMLCYPSKAVSCDGISPKHCALPLYQPLHRLFSLRLSQHCFPLEWHTHLIKPMFKSGDKHCVRNCRPLSLLCIVSKVLERIVYDNMIDFVRSQVSTCQFGFLKGHSTSYLFSSTLSSIAHLNQMWLT